jgi:hypothetical protein
MKIRSPLSVLVRTLPLCALALAACGGGGTDVARLTPAEVAGVYNICSLRFIPLQGALPAANLLQSVINTAPPAPKQPPSLTLSGTENQYQLVYTRKSDNFLQTITSGVHFYPGEIALDFPDQDQSEIVRELLLPTQLWLGFAATPSRLNTSTSLTYSVRRADYARAAGITEEGLQANISGQLTATFATGVCP